MGQSGGPSCSSITQHALLLRLCLLTGTATAAMLKKPPPLNIKQQIEIARQVKQNTLVIADKKVHLVDVIKIKSV